MEGLESKRSHEKDIRIPPLCFRGSDRQLRRTPSPDPLRIPGASREIRDRAAIRGRLDRGRAEARLRRRPSRLIFAQSRPAAVICA